MSGCVKSWRISNETCYWWKKATELAAAHPSPLDGFDIFNYMAIIVFARGTTQARDLFHLWHDELQEKNPPSPGTLEGSGGKNTGFCGMGLLAGPTCVTLTKP